jgi:pseudaminic acid cytidylyltransferase
VKNIAIIPARIGSKRIPKKNIRLFHGKPMIEYSIKTAIESGLFSKVIVSTDSDEIAEVAVKAGAEVPFSRPEEYADDHTPLFAVIEHAIKWYQGKEEFKYACCILATAPFIRVSDLKKGYELIEKERVGSVFSVTSFPFPIFRALKINDKKQLEMFWPEHELTRSNDLPEAYHDAGQFYWLNTNDFLATKKIYSKDAMPVILPRYLVQDIDTLEDWDRAELMYTLVQKVK